jgi:predicted ATPase/DNA-binding SARP family transcriptional activator
MDLRLLGPVEASLGGRPIALGPPKQRAVLAMLALDLGRTVSADRLLEGLWGERQPATAPKMVQLYVSRLRRALDGNGARIVTHGKGYELQLAAGEVDAIRFERLLREARAREALVLWRGEPLADVADEPFAGAEIRRLEELRLAALELAIEQDLDRGRHRDVTPELEALVSADPLRERIHAMLMLALYRSGRQADALAVYRHAREVLVEQLGIEPGNELQELNQAILAHDPALVSPRATDAPASERRSVLPAPPNRTIGRAHEIGAVCERLRAGSVRLLTLTGPGGVGKTRLALEVARLVEADFPDGARFVWLDAVQRAQDVPAEIVRSLGIVLLSGESADPAVERFLAGRQLLLVADNCEHVLGAAPFIGRLLASCPGVTVLATSREPLGVQAEQRWPVPPLALPQPGSAGDPAALAGVDAIALFCERARAHDPEFELGAGNATAVASICRRLDGLPLAIELAAARCGLLSAPEIAGRLHATLGALGSGARDAPARQQTLWATIDWSHDLLGDEEKACFARCAVFVGGASVDAAQAITGASLETLDLLVAKSLLVRRRHPDSPTRLAMLETVRAYALERLAAMPDEDAIRERHHRHYLALAERHGTDRALWGTGHKEHLARLDAEIDNLHAALGWAVAQDDAAPALALAAALGSYWLLRGRYAEAVDWIDQALALPGADAHPALRVRALSVKAWTLWPLGRVAEQFAVMDEAESVARELADPLILSQALQTRADQGAVDHRDLAESLADEALHWATVADDDWAAAMAALAKAMAAGSAPELRERVDHAASLLEAAGNVYYLAELLASAAYFALGYGSDRDASDFVNRATPIARELDTPYLWMTLRGNFALAALLTGDTDAAAEAFREELTLCRELVALPFACEGLNGLAAVATIRRDPTRAARLTGAAAAHRYDSPEDPVEARLRASFLEPARTRCGGDEWDAAVRAGAALSFQDAIAYALEEPPNHAAIGSRVGAVARTAMGGRPPR